MKVTTKTVTPAQAKKWLDGNVHNRPLRPDHVEFLASEMRNGWHPNGDAIRFATDGTLLDGQHRLHACVQSKKPFTTLVVTGLEKAAFDTIDIGRTRTLGDLLGRDGVPSRFRMAAACRAVALIEGGEFKLMHGRFSPTKGHKIFVKHKRGLLRADEVLTPWNVYAVAGSQVLGTYYLCHSKHPRLADTFYRQLGLGVEIKPGSPVHTLREGLLMVDKRRRKGGHQMMRVARDLPLALTVAAWNSTVDKTDFKMRHFAKIKPSGKIKVK